MDSLKRSTSVSANLDIRETTAKKVKHDCRKLSFPAGSTGFLIKRAIFDQFGATFTLFLKTLSGQGKRS